MSINEFDLNIVDDGLKGYWWNWIRVKDFAFPRFYTQEKVKLEHGDILIHKEKKPEERFPTIRYHLVDKNQLLELSNKDIKLQLKEQLIKYIKEHNKLPHACAYIKSFKNGNIQVDYKPSKFDNFALTLIPSDYPEYPDFENMLKTLTNSTNPILDGEDGCEYTIKPIKDQTLLLVKGEKDKIFVERGCIVDINKRKEYFQQHHTSFYLISLKNSQASCDNSGKYILRGITDINFRLSKAYYLQINLKKGDIVQFSGIYHDDEKYGCLIQNIRKVEILKE